MRVALAQVTSGPNPAENIAIVDAWTERAAARGAELVVFPEAMMRAFGSPLGEIAEPVDGAWAGEVREIAARHRVAIIAGMFTPDGSGRVRNTLLIAGAGLAESYDKVHLFDAYGFAESRTVAGGAALTLFDLGGLRFGVATCYDIRFPQLFLALAAGGAEVMVVPASWGAGEGKAEALTLLARARALDTTAYILVCDQADPRSAGLDPGSAPTGVGHSSAVAPDGSVMELAGAGPELLVVDLDAARVRAVREELPVLANARLAVAELPAGVRDPAPATGGPPEDAPITLELNSDR